MLFFLLQNWPSVFDPENPDLFFPASVESDAQGFVLHRDEPAHEHLGEGRVHQVAVGLGDGGRRLGEGHRGLQLERGGRGRQEVGGARHVVHQPLVLLLRQALADAVALRERGQMSTSAPALIRSNQLQVLSNYVPSRTHDGVIYVVIATKHSSEQS